MRRSVFRAIPLTIAIALGSLASGCASYSLQPGIWELSYTAEDEATGEPVAIPKVKVQLFIEEADEPDLAASKELTSDQIEQVELRPLERFDASGKRLTAKGLKPIFAYVFERNHAKYLRSHPRSHDDDYSFLYEGRIDDEHTVTGIRFYARHKRERISLRGIWSLRFLGEE